MASMITGPRHGLTCRARQQLKSPEAAEAFNQDLLSHLGTDEGDTRPPSFDDFDISQNPIPVEQFETLFTTLTTAAVRVQRIRLFGCATLNDEVCGYIAAWLSQVTQETVPWEMHLSDCAITSEGFNLLMEAIENNDAIPQTNPRNQKSPMYIRFEGNYIGQETIQEKVDAGIICPFQKAPAGGAPTQISPDAKVKLLVRNFGDYQQRPGVPPAPEDAPPPKPVNDGKGKGNGKSPVVLGKGGWQQPMHTVSQGVWSQPQPSKGGSKGGWKGYQTSPIVHRPAVFAPAAQAMKGNPWQHKGAAQVSKGASKGQGAQAIFQPSWKTGAAAYQASAAVRVDRSRTPAPPTSRPSGGLPPPWEEHWSDEYGIPYFWNAKTGDSAWERPTA